MTERRCLAVLALLATTMALVAPSPGLAQEHIATVPPADEEPRPATPSTIVADNPFGLPGTDPIDGGAPIPDPNVEIVQRWAITPQGANDPNAASTRAELSYTGEPGSIIEDGVTVFNLGNDPLTFRIYATDATNGQGGAFTLLAGDVEPTDVGTWVTVAQENVTVAPGMAVTIPITITIPDDASPGDHTGGVVASSATVGATDDGSILNVDRSVGTRLYLRVAGPLRRELAIEDLSTSYDGALNPLDGKVEVTYRIQNRGNVRLAGTHQVTTSGPFGLGRQRTEVVEFPELLPGQGIDITTELSSIPALGLATTEVEATTSGGDSVAAGRVTASSMALALPLPVLLMIAALILGWFARRRFQKHRDTPVPVEAVLVEQRVPELKH